MEPNTPMAAKPEEKPVPASQTPKVSATSILEAALDPNETAKATVETKVLQAGQTVPQGYRAYLIPESIDWSSCKASSTAKSLIVTLRSDMSFHPLTLTGTPKGELKNVFGFGGTNLNLTLRVAPKHTK